MNGLLTATKNIAIGNETQSVELGHILKGAFEICQVGLPLLSCRSSSKAEGATGTRKG